MKHFIFAAEQKSYEVAILIKDSHFDAAKLISYYVEPLASLGVAKDKIIAFDLSYDKKKVSAKHITQELNRLMPVLQKIGIKYIYVADAEYFKTLAKQRKADAHIGYVFPCAINLYNYIQVVLGLNYQGLLYNPNQAPKLDLSLATLASVVNKNYQALGLNIIQHEEYPQTYTEIATFLTKLHQYPSLTCDTEAFSLKLFEAGIGSISFAWNKNCGGAFLVDYKQVAHMNYQGCQVHNPRLKQLLKEFFVNYKGKLVFHNATYDIKVLILNLFMKSKQDYQGMLYGLEIMCRHIDDTKIIAYLALNTTAELSLSLKDLGHEYAGNYAQSDIKDIRLIHPQDLLKYNLTDCLTTWFVYEKYYPVMLQDNQLNIYETIMLPSLRVIIQMELVGMPICLKRVAEVKQELLAIQTKHLDTIAKSKVVSDCEYRLKLIALTDINAKLKTKQHGMDKVANFKFNPNSPIQLTELLYETMDLPILGITKTGNPATGGDTLEKLINHTSNQEYKDVINALIGLSKVDKILTSFIPAFEQAVVKEDGHAYLHGSFNLGGTVSGRLSSSDPNLQNIPSGSEYGKLIKSCFKAPKGWIFAGADFNALEARIDALLTKDSAKLAVYVDGYDSHAYNAYHYWKPKFPEIQLIPPTESLRTFKVDINGVVYAILQGTVVETPNGTQMKIEDYYDTYSKLL